jgi:biotin operon repressor
MTRYQRICQVTALRDIDIYERSILILLCQRCKAGTVVTPQKSIAHALDISERKVRSCMSDLERDGYIKRSKTTLGKSGIQHIDSINLLCTKIGFLEPRRAARCAGLPPARCAAPYIYTRNSVPAGLQNGASLAVINGGRK